MADTDGTNVDYAITITTIVVQQAYWRPAPWVWYSYGPTITINSGNDSTTTSSVVCNADPPDRGIHQTVHNSTSQCWRRTWVWHYWMSETKKKHNQGPKDDKDAIGRLPWSSPQEMKRAEGALCKAHNHIPTEQWKHIMEPTTICGWTLPIYC